jgi:hypothetical protein
MLPRNQKKWAGLSLLALSGLSITFPLLDLFGRYPQFFVARGQRGPEVFVFVLGIAGLAPLAILTIGSIARLGGERLGRLVHGGLIFALGAALGLAMLRKLPLRSDVLVWSLAVSAGAAISLAERRSAAFSWGLGVLSVAPLVALGIFIFFSPSSRLIWSRDPGAVPLPGVGRPAPVVIIFFDEFPLATLLRADGAINADRFPNFARLASEAYWFRNASAVAPFTGGSIASALSGIMPHGETPTAVDYPNNLFTLLGSVYQLHVDEELTQLCSASLCDQETASTPGAPLDRLGAAWLDAVIVYGHATLPPGLRTRLPALGHAWAGFLEQAVASPVVAEDEIGMQPRAPHTRTTLAQAARLGSFIAAIEPSPRPTLHFIHVVLPHFPWEMTPSAHTYQPESRLYDDLKAIPGLESEGDRWSGNTFLVRQGLQRHVLQVGYVDRLIGELIDHLQAVGLWEDAVVVVLADHGVAFVPDHPRRGPTPETLAEIYRVPLFIKLPHQATGETRDDNAMLIDLLPTLVDVLDIEMDWVFDGRSLFGDAPPPLVKRVVEGPTGQIPAALDGLFAVARRNAASFHFRDDWLGVAAVGEHGDLVGQPVSGLDGSWQAVDCQLDQADALAQVDFSSGYVPLLVTGRLQLPEGMPAPGEMLVGLNGLVAGLGGVLECKGGVCQFSALLAEEAFREGVNEIQFFAQRGP